MKNFKGLFFLLSLLTVLVWLTVFSLPDKQLRLIACDVGQGDAILITYKDQQILIDGGPDNKVIDCLSRHLPFWDRKIEVVILTHPDQDHFGGLLEVFKRYRVVYFLENRLEISKQEYQVLKELVGSSRTNVVNPIASTKVGNSLIHLDIYNQIGGEKEISEERLNDYSLVIVLNIGQYRALLTGDAPATVLEKELALSGVEGINYIKVPHHGAKSGLTQGLLEKLRPQLAVISVGKNSYGHPTKEILDLLNNNKIKTLRTDQEGDIIVSRPL